jgi:neurofibromin 1
MKTANQDQITIRIMSISLKDLSLNETDLKDGELIAKDGDDESGRSELFLKYFKFFLRALDSYNSSNKSLEKHINNLRGETISALSNLLSSNLSVGIKHSLSIAYDNNPVLRGIFAQVLTNVMKNGLEKNLLVMNEDSISIDQKYNNMNDALLEEPYLILQGIAEVIEISEAENLIKTYIDLLSRKGKLIEAITYLINVELNSVGKFSSNETIPRVYFAGQVHRLEY